MKYRNAMLKVLNPLLALLFVNQLLTGYLAAHLSPRAFELFHLDAAGVLAAGIVLHIVLNWNWIKANFWPRKRA